MKYVYTWGRRLYFFITGLGIALLLSGVWVVSQSPLPLLAATSTLPIQTYTNEQGQAAPIVDFTGVTFNTLSGFSDAGSSGSRSWSAGQSPAEVSTLGDFEGTFDLQALTLDEISASLGTDTGEIALADLGRLFSEQTLGSLASAVPKLGDYTLEESPFVQDLLAPIGEFDANQTIEAVLTDFPQLEDLEVDSIDLNSYTVDTVPNLDITQLGQLDGWESVTIAEVANLGDLAWSDFPTPPSPIGTAVARADLVFAAVEGGKDGKTDFDETQVLTGSNVSGYNAPCQDLCEQLEIVHPDGSQTESVLNGKLLISGGAQAVPGGLVYSVNSTMARSPPGSIPMEMASKWS